MKCTSSSISPDPHYGIACKAYPLAGSDPLYLPVSISNLCEANSKFRQREHGCWTVGQRIQIRTANFHYFKVSTIASPPSFTKVLHISQLCGSGNLDPGISKPRAKTALDTSSQARRTTSANQPPCPNRHISFDSRKARLDKRDMTFEGFVKSPIYKRSKLDSSIVWAANYACVYI